MNICIAGGTGFLGQALSDHFSLKGHRVFILTRKPTTKNDIHWNGSFDANWAKRVKSTDVLINLCGKSVDCRYTLKNKAAILQSRVEPTMALHKAIESGILKPKLWLNASSATIYTHAETQFMDEINGAIGDDFSMNVCKKWEGAFFSKIHDQIRQVALRTSIVLGKSGGAFSKLKPLAKLGFGGHQGNGKQMVSWIHIVDFCKAIEYIIRNDDIKGVANITSPHPISNQEFMKQLRHKMNRPIGIPQPIWLLELGAAIVGTETELLLKSRYVQPTRLLESGFAFEYSKINQCLEELCQN